MTNRTAATRYARALFDVAVKEKADLDADRTRARGVRRPVQRSIRLLEKVLLNPAVPAPRKRAAVADAARRAPELHADASRSCSSLLAERDRLVLLPDLLAAYRERLLDHQNVVRAEVTTAAPLSRRARAGDRARPGAG